MAQAALILGGALLTVLVSLAAGQLVFGLLRLPVKGLERGALAFLTGSGLLSLAVFLLAAAGVARWQAFIGLAVLTLLASGKRVFSFGWQRGPGLEAAWRISAGCLFGVFSAIYLLTAMAPEHSPDGSSYHLGQVRLYMESGRLAKVTDDMYAMFPQGIEMLFLYAFSIGKHSAASLVEFAFLVALAVLIYSFGRRLGHPVAGLLASFAVYASPVVGWTATRAYIDVAVAALIFGMFHLLYFWEQGLPDESLIPAGMLAGFAFGSKYTALLAIPFGVAFILAARGRRKARLAAPFAFLLAAVPVFEGWLIRNLAWTGNPVAPFLNRWFPNPHFFPSFEDQYAEVLRWPGGLSGWASVPLEVTLQGGAAQGLLGPLFLLAPVALLSLRSPAGRRLCAAALVFAAAYPFNKGTRFLMLSLPFLALAMAMELARHRRLAGALMAAHAVTCLPAVVDRYSNPHAVRLGPLPTLAEALRKKPEEEFLRGKRFGYEAARMVERLVPPDEQAYSFLVIPAAYSSRRVLVYHTSARANLVGETLFTAMDATPMFGGRMLASGVSPDLSPVCEMGFSFRPRKVRAARLVLRNAAGGGLWVVTDVRASLSGREVPWPASSRFAASHSPWYASRAFDANPVTLWSSREPAREGMRLTAEFAAELELDSVTVLAPRDQGGLFLELETMDAGGGWTAAGSSPRVSIVPAPPDLRALASRQVLRDGIGYLLVNEGNLVADDFRGRAPEWKVEAVDSDGDFTLYRILP